MTKRPTVGMIGGGQLARMTHQAALDLGVELFVLCEDERAPAVLAGATHVSGSPSRREDLKRLAARCDVVTFDHELVETEALEAIALGARPVRPSPQAKVLAQDKLAARRWMRRLGLPVPAFAAVRSSQDLGRFAEVHGWPLVLKARRGGYDGRGVWLLDDPSEAKALLQPAGGEMLVEECVDIRRELAVVAVRRPNGEARVYPVLETVQRDGTCREVLFPAGSSNAVAVVASELATTIAREAGAEGLCCVELFETADGLVVNELALRPHNSAHLTIEACATSQFHNHLRGVLDWPLGSTEPLVPAAAMVNVIGAAEGSDPAERLPQALEVTGASIRLYGKRPRPGRKLGHVTATADSLDWATATARNAAERLAA